MALTGPLCQVSSSDAGGRSLLASADLFLVHDGSEHGLELGGGHLEHPLAGLRVGVLHELPLDVVVGLLRLVDVDSATSEPPTMKLVVRWSCSYTGIRACRGSYIRLLWMRNDDRGWAIGFRRWPSCFGHRGLGRCWPCSGTRRVGWRPHVV